MPPDQLEAELVAALDRLHRAKSAAYGDAWRKRGELLSIFCNIARKFDRLQVARVEVDVSAEPELDTAADLTIYSCKYLCWLAETHPESFAVAGPGDPAVFSAIEGDAAVTKALNEVADRASIGDLERGPIDDVIDRHFEWIERRLVATSEGELPTPSNQASKIEHVFGLATASFSLLAEIAETDQSWRETLQEQIR